MTKRTKMVFIDVVGLAAYAIFVIPTFGTSSSLFDFSIVQLILAGMIPLGVGLLLAIGSARNNGKWNLAERGALLNFLLWLVTPIAILGLAVLAMHLLGFVTEWVYWKYNV